MMKVNNMFREFSLGHIDGYANLSNTEKELFDITYKQHLSSMPMEERVYYLENHLKKIEKKKIEGQVSILKTYFTHEVYLYLPGSKWIKIS